MIDPEMLFKFFQQSVFPTQPELHADWNKVDGTLRRGWEMVAAWAELEALCRPLEELEKLAVANALRIHKGHISLAAAALGCSARGLHYKIRRFNLDASEFREPIRMKETTVKTQAARLPDEEEESCG